MKKIEDVVVAEADQFLAESGASVGDTLPVLRALSTAYVVHRMAAVADSGAAFLAKAKRSIRAAIRTGGDAARRAMLYSLRRPKWALAAMGRGARNACNSDYILRISDLLADPEIFGLLTTPVGSPVT